MTNRLREISERLERATPGPWNIERVDHEHEITFEIGTDEGFFAKIYEHDFIDQGRNAKPTCELIAHAPDDLRYLLSLVERLEKVRAAAEDVMSELRLIGRSAPKLHDALKELEGLDEALA